jgi:hypothetical protein
VEVDATGSVTGELRSGEVLLVRIDINDPEGWQGVREVRVELQLRGRPLDQLVIDLAALSIHLVDEGPVVGLGREETLRGSYLRVSTRNVAVRGQGNELRVTLPMGLLAQPPPGARLFYDVSALGYTSPGPRPLTPPVQEEDAGFSWGTLAAAVALALFAGGFVGNLFSSRRSRQRPSIYATVQRRLEQDRTRT